MKIGLIIPSSMLFPTVGLQFSEGAILAKKLFGSDKDEVIIEGAETATDSAQVQKAANKLLLQDRVDVIVAYAGHNTFDTLTQICTEYKKILILADMGGVIAYKIDKSPYVFMHSMNEWAATYNLGKTFGDKKKVLSAISMMEAGYSVGYSFIKGLEEAGGSVDGFQIAKLDIDDAYFEQLKKEISETDTVYCSFTGKDADTLISGVGTELADDKLQLAGSGWFTLPTTLAKHGATLLGTKTASSYYTTIDSEANKTFLKEFEENTENDADRFALLGYEIVMMLLKAATYNDDGSKLMSKKTIAALEQTEIDSPRGKVSYNKSEHYAVSGCWFAEVKKDDNDNYYNHITDKKDIVDMDVWRADKNNWPSGGWFNPYPCT